ncbi:patellin-3-like [Tasmannia lanceolata]|uniref:patellin-3-like n=1 Tax=Tasmannia lanceolata TaxID=3420 RepID=UPI004062BA7F
MAEEAQVVSAEEVVAADDPPAKKSTEKDPPPPPVAEESKPSDETVTVSDPEAKKKSTEEEVIPESVSFKEESSKVSDLQDPEKKALDELKKLIEVALKNHEFTKPPPPPKEEEKEKEKSDIPPTEEPAKPDEPAPPEAEATSKPEGEEKPPEAEVPAEIPAETPAVVTEVVEEAIVVSPPIDEDGAKTVEAIEETIVSVTAPVPETEAPVTESEAPVVEQPPEDVFIWGIPLIGDEKSDVVLLKFLRARDFKVKDAFTMIKNTVIWRKEFGIEGLLEEDLGSDLEKVVFMHGFDKEGHPVCYNIYGEFQNKELYQKTFSDEEKRQKFLRWRIQFLEKGIQQLDFTPGGISTIVQVTDLKNSPGPAKRELRQATNQALSLLQDNYPEFVAKQVFINVPWWYLAFNRMISPFLTQRTKSKFVFAGPSKSTDTLFKYMAPEQVPIQYGGLSKDTDSEFCTADAVTEVTIKPTTKHSIELPASEACLLIWELRVLGWDVSYCAEFVPSSEDGYTVIVHKTRKLIATDEPVLKNSFKIGEPGKIVLTIDNTTSKKRKLLYRSKAKSSSDSI